MKNQVLIIFVGYLFQFNAVCGFNPTVLPCITTDRGRFDYVPRPALSKSLGLLEQKRQRRNAHQIKPAVIHPIHQLQSHLYLSPMSTGNLVAWTSMGVLAVQFGAMPTLQKKYLSKDICRSSVVLVQETCKFTLSALCLLVFTGPIQGQAALSGWSVKSWWQLAAIPAALYAIQNYAKLMAYQHLPAVTYSVLNQTKTLCAAVFCYFLLGQQQSPVQMAALVLLLFSALVIEEVFKFDRFISMLWSVTCRLPQLSILRWKPNRRGQLEQQSLFQANGTTKCSPPPKKELDGEKIIARDPYHVTRGVLPLLLANLTSGLAAALGQRALQQHKRNVYLYGMELSSASFVVMLLALLWTYDGQRLRNEGITKHWKRCTWIPIGAHTVGGMLVGLVTKYAGSVQKGFALIFGVLLSGLLQKWISHEDVTKEQVLGGLLACISLWMYSSYPPPSTRT